MSNLSTLPKGDSAWLLRKAIERIMQQVSVLETNIGSSTTGNSLDGQIIFNDNGTLRGDTGLTYAKSTTTLRAGLLIVPGNTQLATIGILYVGTTANPRLKVDVGANLTTITNADITGALTVDTSTLKVDAAADQVGIGTATPASYAGNKLVVYDSTNGQIAIANSTAHSNLQSNGVDLYINTNVSGASSNAGSFIVRHGSGFTTQLTIDSSNNVNVQAGNVVMVTSGKGIDFSATSSNGTSELLNDYEEGTWVGTLTGATTDPTIAVTATGRYTKVGRLVTVQIAFSNVITTGASGQIKVTGLPFTNNGTASSCGSVLLYSMGTFTGSPVANVGINESFVGLYSSITNAAFAEVTHNAGVTRFLTTSITYTV